MLSFAAHVPHTPLLLSTIGRENTEALKKTEEALKIIAGELYASNPDVLIILTGHGNHSPDVFSINLNHSYQTDLSEFGDIVTKKIFISEPSCADKFQRFMRRSGVNLSLFSEQSIGYSVSVPLLTLTEKIKKICVLPIFAATNLSPKNHFEFGQLMKEIIFSSDKRVAVISAGDLSHALSAKAPVGLRPEGQEFDEITRQALKNLNVSGLLQLDPELVARATECAYRPVLMLLGLLEGTGAHAEELCYEAPFGVGYLTVGFRL